MKFHCFKSKRKLKDKLPTYRASGVDWFYRNRTRAQIDNRSKAKAVGRIGRPHEAGDVHACLADVFVQALKSFPRKKALFDE